MEVKSIEKIEPYNSDFEYCYANYYKKIYSFAYKNLKDHQKSQDFTHDIFARFYKYRHLYDPNRSRVYTFLVTLARKKIAEYVWKHNSILFNELCYHEEFHNNLDEKFSNCISIEDSTISNMHVNRVIKRIAKLLPKKDFLLFYLRIMGCSYSCIGETLELSESNARIRFFKIKNFLVSKSLFVDEKEV